MKTLRRITLALFLLALLIAGAAFYFVSTPYRGFQGQTFVRIEHGTGTQGIAQTLTDAGVLQYPWQLLILRAARPSSKLQAGEYRFSTAASPSEVFDRLARGDVYYFDFTVKEGNNMFDIAQALAEAEVMPADDFLRAASDPALIHDLVPGAKSLEGYLFPSTYRLSHWVTAPALCKQMTQEFRRQWSKLPAAQTADVSKTVTLASLVEKETGVPEERPLVAGVFTNRLEKGMRLECDPTTIYAALLESRYHGKIHRSDLANQNPYNTYQNAGLPPGPIANPGAAALAAALAPAQTDYIFFVAKPGGGGHQFSSNLAAHEKAVQEYRHGTRKPAKTPGKTG